MLAYNWAYLLAADLQNWRHLLEQQGVRGQFEFSGQLWRRCAFRGKQHFDVSVLCLLFPPVNTV